MTDEIINFLETKDVKASTLKKIWNVLYEDFEEFPGKSEATVELVVDALSDAETKKTKKIHKILFKEEED